ncbi:uncharacterized protein MONOS_1616 [Monocercomonoides exilis]|uniref:uncharacterized protein n=1 Tax=Monocercomonoides exilis TaxID=2049356 RepID=UPI00355A61D9|nr:hypothetical protein MONOS_1616 [Monocercomonoides exilis]
MKMSTRDRTETYRTKKFTELFSELEDCDEIEQKVGILEINKIIDEMNEEELESIFTPNLFNKVDKMIEEKKMTMKNAILLLKHVGYCNVLKNVCNRCFRGSSLNKIFEEMIFKEEKKRKEKDEKFLVDLCECYLLLSDCYSLKFVSVCVPCLLKVALNKEESEENQKEVETALFTLSYIGKWNDVGKILFLEEIKEIIQYNQEHRNLTRLAYQSAIQFLTDRLYKDISLEQIIMNELHFVKEARRELEELIGCIDWKRERKEKRRGKEAKEELVLLRWLKILDFCFDLCKLWNEEYVGLIDSIAQVHRAAKENNREICFYCIYSFKLATENIVVKVEDLLNGGAVDAVLEEIRQSMLIDKIALSSLEYMLEISERLKDEVDDEKGKEERKIMKKKVIEKMEEEGYEDVIVSFQEILPFLCKNFNIDSLDISDYFVNI